MPSDHLTHLDETGAARMVDVGAKPATTREAVAATRIDARNRLDGSRLIAFPDFDGHLGKPRYVVAVTHAGLSSWDERQPGIEQTPRSRH